MTLPQRLRNLSEPSSAEVQCESLAQLLRNQAWAFEAHAHSDLDQFYWINKGAGRMQIDGATRGFGPNTAIFVPAGTVHGFEFGPVAAGWVITFARPLAIPVSLPDHTVQSAVTQREDQAALTAICDEINREQQAGDIGGDAALACQAGLLGVWLLRHMEAEAQIGRETSQKRLMRRFLHLLEDRYQSHETVSHYAQRLSVTPTHLTRVCRQTSGKSATVVIQNRMLFEARRQLAYTDARVNDIARELGFTSPAYFTRLFAQKTGMSPTVFRRKVRAPTPSSPNHFLRRPG